jgi:hypothetical protein
LAEATIKKATIMAASGSEVRGGGPSHGATTYPYICAFLADQEFAKALRVPLVCRLSGPVKELQVNT